MNILVLGRSGQLATALAEVAGTMTDVRLHCAGRPELDLSSAGQADALIAAERPDLVINAAAYTAVDKAEEDSDAAYRLNAEGAAEAAAAALRMGASFIQVSTDYVFNGSGDRPWREDDRPEPLGIYGKSKLAGEEQVRLANPQALIVRTSWVYGPTAPNFVATMLRLAESRSALRIVDDQVGCPTHAEDLAAILLQLAGRWPEPAGSVLHVAGPEALSWADLAREIFLASERLGGPVASVSTISSEEYGAAAPRPGNSRLCCDLLRDRFGLVVPGWRERIDGTVAKLLADADQKRTGPGKP